jgi:phosphate:Na+ symporter
MIGTFLGFLGSLGMFIFGMKVMSESLQKLSGERLRGAMSEVERIRNEGP